MSVLPRSIPAPFTQRLEAALTAAGVAFDPALKPGSRITHQVAHNGREWSVRYIGRIGGEPLWQLFGEGPDYEWGPSADEEEIVAAVTAPAPQPEPEQVDAHPGAPRTHLGFKVPEFVRAEWDSPRAEWFRLGLAAAVGQLPDTRPRA